MNADLSLLNLAQQYNRLEDDDYPNRSSSIGGLVVAGGVLLFLLLLSIIVWIWAVWITVSNWKRLPTWAKVMCVLCILGTFVSRYGFVLSIVCIIIVYSGRGTAFAPPAYGVYGHGGYGEEEPLVGPYNRDRSPVYI